MDFIFYKIIVQLIISLCPFCLSISSLSSCSRAFNRSAAIDELRRSSGGVDLPLVIGVVGCDDDDDVVDCCGGGPDCGGGADDNSGDTGGDDDSCVRNSGLPCLMGGIQPGRAADILARNDWNDAEVGYRGPTPCVNIGGGGVLKRFKMSSLQKMFI